jgi:2-polyprenyl-3-methyl-5-hydroxy-6-metoxy-1,4-benzoquinol methylase
VYIESFDYAWYSQNEYWYDDPLYYLQQRAWVALFSEWIEGNRFIEFGGASGELVSELQRAYPSCHVTYNDVKDVCSPERVPDAKEIGTIEEVSGELVLQGATFDAIFVFDVLEHSKRPRASLAALRCLLAPGGRIFSISDNGDDMHSLSALRFHDEHMHIWSQKSWQLMVTQEGLHETMYWARGNQFYSVLESI